ncbi:trifunctional transcriptional activator/DNA repair protein Ada/methylated-DNA--[protein]-cysteine S-methyltransferase [Rhizobiaceae bacterium BDR2-2]|uniref:methylated-DNA--[protein]-cysteine S-methyltransferase n=1 Tax=Ectorhizobium quercum TaxID=2965071 RepID=A0AAE3MZT3_9HYPH|nr:trifunctional transcriptional activator/DNA repair protein Ada/methylated-DNA--[protein]-cysteine S-methyltransferase [Ectorhizobium quercum]MCX8997377.1 trifunctional transcriptional activator/DNA repair protein Ada/methylated-DNA--[protein]-cysteine S-methyltransferase [Ectorhizobium quercum]
MLFPLPDTETLYRALLDRDPAYDGRAYVGVTSTGIFCRLTCPARKPKPENCRFFASVAECMSAGFRACLKCHPMAPAAEADPIVAALLKLLADRPGYRWGEQDLERMGFDPSTVRRSFKRHFGITFLEMARLERLRLGFETLGDGGRVIDAQQDAGFESPSAFRSAFSRLIGQPPGRLAENALLQAHWLPTPLGTMIAVTDERALHLLEFADRKALPGELKKLFELSRCSLGVGRLAPHAVLETQLDAYFTGRSPDFTIPLALHGSDFTRSVWEALRQIPPGAVRSYGEVASAIGRPSATRAVARANGANQIALIIPCHRVIGADGSLTGYGGGLWRKQKLIEIERQFTR